MDPWQRTRRPGPLALLVAICLAGTLQASAQSGNASAQAASAELQRQASVAAYNLEHQEALTLLRKAVALTPHDPPCHHALATTICLEILFQRGALTVDHYLGSLTRSNVELRKPDPALDAEFREHSARAVALAQA